LASALRHLNDGDVHAVDITPCQRCSTASSKRGTRSLEIPSSGWPLSGSPWGAARPPSRWARWPRPWDLLAGWPSWTSADTVYRASLALRL